MSQLQQYVQDAIRTESRIESIQTDTVELLHIMRAYVAVGNMLDDMKKNIFYGKAVNPQKWRQNKLDAIQHLADCSQLSTIPTDKLDVDSRLFHAIIGMATESTELVEAIIKAVDTNADIDHVNVQEELGDLNWYQAIAVDASNADWDKILETNISKLKHRYPEKFTSDKAINRDLDTERQILEDGAKQSSLLDSCDC